MWRMAKFAVAFFSTVQRTRFTWGLPRVQDKAFEHFPILLRCAATRPERKSVHGAAAAAALLPIQIQARGGIAEMLDMIDT